MVQIGVGGASLECQERMGSPSRGGGAELQPASTDSFLPSQVPEAAKVTHCCLDSAAGPLASQAAPPEKIGDPGENGQAPRSPPEL